MRIVLERSLPVQLELIRGTAEYSVDLFAGCVCLGWVTKEVRGVASVYYPVVAGMDPTRLSVCYTQQEAEQQLVKFVYLQLREDAEYLPAVIRRAGNKRLAVPSTYTRTVIY